MHCETMKVYLSKSRSLLISTNCLLITFLVLSSLGAAGSGCASFQEIMREVGNDPHPQKGTRVRVDLVDLQKDHFRVTTQSISLKHAPANIPLDAIRDGLIEFGGLSNDYQYLSRITTACAEGIRRLGFAELIYTHEEVRIIQLHYNPEAKHLIFVVNTGYFSQKISAMDLSDVDVSIQ